MEVKNIYINNTLKTAKRWQWPLNRGGRFLNRGIKYSSLLTNELELLESGRLIEGGR